MPDTLDHNAHPEVESFDHSVDTLPTDITLVENSTFKPARVETAPVKTAPGVLQELRAGNEGETAAEDSAYGSPEERIIANYLQSRSIKILFNGAIRLPHQRASTSLEMRISRPETNSQWLEDRIILDHQGVLKGSVCPGSAPMAQK